jgi:hypothetical protein
MVTLDKVSEGESVVELGDSRLASGADPSVDEEASEEVAAKDGAGEEAGDEGEGDEVEDVVAIARPSERGTAYHEVEGESQWGRSQPEEHGQLYVCASSEIEVNADTHRLERASEHGKGNKESAFVRGVGVKSLPWFGEAKCGWRKTELAGRTEQA